MKNNERLDVFLFESGRVQSREKAKKLIMAGKVLVNDRPADKASFEVKADDTITIKEEERFVSRGGHKLERAMTEFNIDLTDKVSMDIGASTGGFTDCMLQNGARYVYAIDVGYGQLDWKLRNDNRVCVMERFNARYLEKSMLKEVPFFASIDVSFISLSKIIKPLFDCLEDDGEIVALIKPQFEAGKEYVGKNGVIRDEKVHKMVVQNVIKDFNNAGYSTIGLSYSPIKGPKGNIEFLIYAKKCKNITDYAYNIAENIVKEAHMCLNKGNEGLL